MRVIRFPLAIVVRETLATPTLCAPAAGGTGEITVLFPRGRVAPWATASVGCLVAQYTQFANTTLVMFPTLWPFSIDGSVTPPTHTSAQRCIRSRGIIFNRANSFASLANFRTASLTFRLTPHPSSCSNFLVLHLTVKTDASWDRCTVALPGRGKTRPSLNFDAKKFGRCILIARNLVGCDGIPHMGLGQKQR